MEAILIGQLENITIVIPEALDFECENRMDLLQQLEVLRTVINKNKNKGNNFPSESSLNTDFSIANKGGSTSGQGAILKRKTMVNSKAEQYTTEKVPKLFSGTTSSKLGKLPLKKF